MKWNIKRGRIYTSKQGTAKAHLYYWIRHEGVKHFTAGYYGFGRDIAFTDRGEPRRFFTIEEAKRFCENTDANALVIEAI